MIKKVDCIKCNEYRKLENPKISYVFSKTLVLSIIFDKGCRKDEKRFKKEESVKILKILGLIKNIEDYQINI